MWPSRDCIPSRLSPSTLFLIKGRRVERGDARGSFLISCESELPLLTGVLRQSRTCAQCAHEGSYNSIYAIPSSSPFLRDSLVSPLLFSVPWYRDISAWRTAHSTAFLIGINGGNVEATYFEYQLLRAWNKYGRSREVTGCEVKRRRVGSAGRTPSHHGVTSVK